MEASPVWAALGEVEVEVLLAATQALRYSLTAGGRISSNLEFIQLMMIGLPARAQQRLTRRVLGGMIETRRSHSCHLCL